MVDPGRTIVQEVTALIRGIAQKVIAAIRGIAHKVVAPAQGIAHKVVALTQGIAHKVVAPTQGIAHKVIAPIQQTEQSDCVQSCPLHSIGTNATVAPERLTQQVNYARQGVAVLQPCNAVDEACYNRRSAGPACTMFGGGGEPN